MREVGDLHTGREGPSAGIRHHEPVAFETLQRLTDRGAAHTERLRQLVVVDRLAGLDVQHDQLVADREVGPVRKGHRRRVQLDGHSGHLSIVNAAGPEVLPQQSDRHTLAIVLIYQTSHLHLRRRKGDR